MLEENYKQEMETIKRHISLTSFEVTEIQVHSAAIPSSPYLTIHVGNILGICSLWDKITALHHRGLRTATMDFKYKLKWIKLSNSVLEQHQKNGHLHNGKSRHQNL